MSRFITFLILTLSTGAIAAQPDAYHENLIDWLGTQYTLSGHSFPYADTEEEHFAMFNSYNSASEQLSDDMEGQDFTKVESIRIATATTNRWDAGWNGANTETVTLGDKILWVIYLRATGPEGNGRVTLFAERNDTYAKETEVTVELTPEWKRYFIPFEVITRTQPVGGMTMGMHLGHQAQTVEIGGMAILNYGSAIDLDQLPNDLSSDEYGGFETDAAWRAPAADRIDQLRKADLQLTVLDNSGNPLPDAQVEIRMQRHDFDFGTAVKASRFPGGREYSETFVNRINDLDGRGHGFSAVVFENDLKWPAWEEEWISTNAQTRRTLRYLSEQDIDIRGHVLLWPGWDNLPSRMESNRTNPDYLKQQLEDHLVEFLQTENFDEFVKDWDVVNEINTNTDLAAALSGTAGYTNGREIYAETFTRAKELAPDAKLYINDYITLSLKNTEGAIIYDQYKGYIQELVDQNAPIDGIGFQAHLGASPNSIYEVLETLDDFHDEFGLEAKITELDMPGNVSEELAAKYLSDFLTATFSHESMTGIMFWNFWDVDTWANPGMNLYNENWTRTEPGDAYVDLIFGDWWTDEDVTTNVQGNATVRGFKGSYEVSVACPGGIGTIALDLTEDEAVTIDCATLVSTTLPELPPGSVAASPNPSADFWRISNTYGSTLSAELFDVNGRRIWAATVPPGSYDLNLALATGVYTLRFTDGQRASTLRLIRTN
jgi:GH35 family endo-1,4-beta-xylanase